MAKLIKLSNGKCDLKFGSKPTNFKGVKKFKYKKNHFNLYIDKNDSVYDVKRSELVAKNEFKETRDIHLFNKIKGNPTKIAMTKIAAEIDMLELLS